MNTQSFDEKKVQIVCCCPTTTGGLVFWGAILVSLGVLGLLSTVLPLQHLGQYVWPTILLLWGGYILFGLRRVRN